MAGCPGTSAGPSCSTRPTRCSPRRAITPQRWTTSPRRPACPSPCSTSTSLQARPLSRAARPAAATRLVEVVAEALASTDHNADRVVATMGAFYEFVSSASGEFRFVFESDLTGDGRVQERLWRVNNEIADAIAAVIAEDTALPGASSRSCWRSRWSGIAQVSARYWVSGDAARSPGGGEAARQQPRLARDQRLPADRAPA